MNLVSKLTARAFFAVQEDAKADAGFRYHKVANPPGERKM